jgi:hypothetical protein
MKKKDVKRQKENIQLNYTLRLVICSLWDTAKAVLREKFIVMSACIKNTERSPINDPTLHLKLLEKQE